MNSERCTPICWWCGFGYRVQSSQNRL
jgi:hypothetical protein